MECSHCICVCQCEKGLSTLVWVFPTVLIYFCVRGDCLNKCGCYHCICVCLCERVLSKSVWNFPTVFVYVCVRGDCLRIVGKGVTDGERLLVVDSSATTESDETKGTT